MLPRTRSIFHLGEEGEREEIINEVIARESGKGLVGLQILIIQHHGQGSNILFKSSMKPCKKQASTDFLKSCFFCNEELSLQKEIYMYRGDQGFCSVECRYKQILQDERRELDASRRVRLRMPDHQHTISKMQESNRTKISIAA